MATVQLNDLVRFYLPLEVIERAGESDPDSCLVRGRCYSSAEVPGDNWVLPYEVLKEMARDYTGAIREMHRGDSAAGVADSIDFDDVARACDLTAEVVDSGAAKKCRKKVYKFFSLGVKPSHSVLRADGKRVVQKGVWRETSLCDVGMDKGATLSLVRLEGAEEPYEVEEVAETVEREVGDPPEPEPVAEVAPEVPPVVEPEPEAEPGIAEGAVAESAEDAPTAAEAEAAPVAEPEQPEPEAERADAEPLELQRFDESQPRDPDGKWTVIRGYRVSITGEKVKDHKAIDAAATLHGVNAEGRAALHKGFEDGHIRTDDHLLRAIAHGTEAGGGKADYEAGIVAHGHGGKLEGKATKVEGVHREIERHRTLPWAGDAYNHIADAVRHSPGANVKDLVAAAEAHKRDQGTILTPHVDIDNAQGASRGAGIHFEEAQLKPILKGRNAPDEAGADVFDRDKELPDSAPHPMGKAVADATEKVTKELAASLGDGSISKEKLHHRIAQEVMKSPHFQKIAGSDEGANLNLAKSMASQFAAPEKNALEPMHDQRSIGEVFAYKPKHAAAPSPAPEGGADDDVIKLDYKPSSYVPKEKFEGQKQPYEMTSGEWEAEKDKIRPNAQGTGGGGYQTNIGKSVAGAERANQYRMDRLHFLKMGLKDANVEGMQFPALHHNVIEHALKQGKKVPAHVLAEYPELKSANRTEDLAPEDLARADDGVSTSADVPAREHLEGPKKADARRIKKVTHYDCGSDDGCCGHVTRGGAYECMVRRGDLDASEVERMMAQDEAAEELERLAAAEPLVAVASETQLGPIVERAEILTRFETLERTWSTRFDELAQTNDGLLERVQQAEADYQRTQTQLQSAQAETEVARSGLSAAQKEVEVLRRMEVQQTRPVLYPDVARLERSFAANDGLATEVNLEDVRAKLEQQKVDLQRAPQGESELARTRRVTQLTKVDMMLARLDGAQPVY